MLSYLEASPFQLLQAEGSMLHPVVPHVRKTRGVSSSQCLIQGTHSACVLFLQSVQMDGARRMLSGTVERFTKVRGQAEGP